MLMPPSNGSWVGSSTAPIRDLPRPKRASKYNLVSERVTQEKKKLRSRVTFHTQPPPGYTFIPAGNPDLTQALKEFARQGNYEILAVTTTPHQKVHDLSKEVHRVGFHFPSVVVANVCSHYGIALTKHGTLVGDEDVQNLTRQRHGGRRAQADDNVDQVTINTRAKDTITDLFPNIPENDLYKIIKTAFQKGQHKVGTASELSLVRRAQLSVVAHIRHVYTNYDRLLRTVGYHDARGKVEGPTLKKLVEWRGDDDDGKKVLEEVVRQVVVLTDDEDSDDNSDHAQNMEQDQVDVQMVPYRSRYPQVETVTSVDPRLSPSRQLGYSQYSDEEENSIYRYLPQPPRRRKMIDQQYVDDSQYRHAAWDRAREEYRANPVPLPPIRPVTYLDSSQHDQRSHTARDVVSYDPSVHARPVPESLARRLHYRDIDAPIQPRTTSTIFRAEDGLLYEKVVSTRPDPQRVVSNPQHHDLRLNGDGPHVESTYAVSRAQDLRRVVTAGNFRPASAGMLEEKEYILPSIEGPTPSSTRSRPPFHHYSPPMKDSGHMTPTATVKKPIIDLTDTNQQYSGRKRKFGDSSLIEDQHQYYGEHSTRFLDSRVLEEPLSPPPRRLIELQSSRTTQMRHELSYPGPSQRRDPEFRYVEPTPSVGPSNLLANMRDLLPDRSATSYRIVEASPVYSHRASLLEYPIHSGGDVQSYSLQTPSRVSFQPQHSYESPSVRPHGAGDKTEVIELVSDSRDLRDHRPVYDVAWPVRTFDWQTMASHSENARSLGQLPPEDQMAQSRSQLPIELVPISRTSSHQSQVVQYRREYVSDQDSRAKLPPQPQHSSYPRDYHSQGTSLGRLRLVEPSAPVVDPRHHRLL